MNNILNWILKAKSAGATHLTFYGNVDDNTCETVEIAACYIRLETDAEFYIRKDNEEKEKVNKALRTIAYKEMEYQRLKKDLGY